MSYLIDTNVLLRRVETIQPQHQIAREALDYLTECNEQLYVAPQNLIEFRAVATRPTTGRGIGLTIKQAAAEIAKFEAFFDLAPDTPDIYPQWRRLVDVHQVTGLQAHDARLTAVIAVHNISHILTFNAADFRRYPHVTVSEPQNVKPKAF